MLSKGLALKIELTAARLRELLHYDADTGVFTWKKPTAQCVRVGDRAGSCNRNRDKYRYIQLDGVMHAAHQLAWLYVHGMWAGTLLDHKNGGVDDNWINNLRPATNAENAQNQSVRSTNRSGFPGASWSTSKRKWVAQIMVLGKTVSLGTFGTAEEAGAAYRGAKARMHTFNPAVRAAGTASQGAKA